MIIVLLYAIGILLLVSGLCDFIILLKLYIVSPNTQFETNISVVLKPEIYKQQLNSLLQKRKWYGNAYCNKIIASTERLEAQEVLICRQLYSDCDIVFIDGFNKGEKSENFR